jgi:integrase/recombinase XerD
MQYLDRQELRRLFSVAYERDKRMHLILLVSFWSGLRISETLGIMGRDVSDGQLHVKRLKNSRATTHRVHVDADPVFDCSPLLELAKAHPDQRLFKVSRQWVNKLIKTYARAANIHPAKAHSHVFKHSIAMLLWTSMRDLNAVQDFLGHRSASSSLVYLRAEGAEKAQAFVNSVQL